MQVLHFERNIIICKIHQNPVLCCILMRCFMEPIIRWANLRYAIYYLNILLYLRRWNCIMDYEPNYIFMEMRLMRCYNLIFWYVIWYLRTNFMVFCCWFLGIKSVETVAKRSIRHEHFQGSVELRGNCQDLPGRAPWDGHRSYLCRSQVSWIGLHSGYLT